MNGGEQDQIRQITERVARRVAGGQTVAEKEDPYAALSASLRQIEQRLAHIESHLQHDENCAPPRTIEAAPATRSPWLGGSTALEHHPSAERFGVGEAVSELVDHFEREKTCDLEPGGKPCDHCAMCSSRGF